MWIRCDIWIQMETARSICSLLKISMKEMSVFQMDVFECWKTMYLCFGQKLHIPMMSFSHIVSYNDVMMTVQNKCKWLYNHEGNNF